MGVFEAALVDSIGAAGWAALVTMVGTIVAWLTTRGKNKADVASVMSETSIEWIRELRVEAQRLRDRVDEFEAEVAECEARFDILAARYDRLVAYLRRMGLEVPEDG